MTSAIRRWPAVAVLLATIAGCSRSPVVLIDKASATLQPATDASAASSPIGRPKPVDLAHRWDNEFPGKDGAVTYRLAVPAATASGPRALLLERVGNQAVVKVDGVDVPHLAWLVRPGADAAKFPYLVELPEGASTLEIKATMQALRDGGLWPVPIGPSEAIKERYLTRRLLDQVAPAAYAASLLLIGGLAAGRWWRQRDPVYGCFSLGALFGSMRHLDRVIPEVPVPWPFWGGFLAVAYGVQLALVARFVILVAGNNPRWLNRTLHATCAAVVTSAVLSFAFRQRALWTAAIWLLQGLGCVCFTVVIREA